MSSTRLSVNINEKTKAQILSLKESEEISATEIVHNAIALYSFLKEEEKRGRVVETSNKGKARKEIIFQ